MEVKLYSWPQYTGIQCISNHSKVYLVHKFKKAAFPKFMS